MCAESISGTTAGKQGAQAGKPRLYRPSPFTTNPRHPLPLHSTTSQPSMVIWTDTSSLWLGALPTIFTRAVTARGGGGGGHHERKTKSNVMMPQLCISHPPAPVSPGGWEYFCRRSPGRSGPGRCRLEGGQVGEAGSGSQFGECLAVHRAGVRERWAQVATLPLPGRVGIKPL